MASSQQPFDYDRLLAEATSSEHGQAKVHGAMMQCIDKNGKIIYSKISGSSSINGAEPLRPDAVLNYASSTKLITSIALLQCIERGLLTLDEDLGANILPELAHPQVLDIPAPTGPPEISAHGPSTLPDAPSTVLSQTPITARHLLSHTSGFGYRFIDPHLEAWIQKHKGPDPSSTKVAEKYNTPLLFEPGQGWAYGCGLDWAGEVVRRVVNRDGGRPRPDGQGADQWISLQDYFVENIWKVVGRTQGPWPVFGLNKPGNEAYRARLMEAGMRDAASGALKPWIFPYSDVQDEEGGAGLSGTMEDYIAVLGDLVADEPRLLSRETIALMFERQIPERSRGIDMLGHLRLAWEPVAGPVRNEAVNHGLGGMLVEEEAEAIGQPAHVLAWGGALNSVWWISRDLGVAGFFATQIVPLGEAPARQLIDGWKKDFWGRFRRPAS